MRKSLPGGGASHPGKAVFEGMNRHPQWTPLRRAVQASVALFYLALPVINRLGFRAVGGNLASLKLGPVDLLEPASTLAAFLAAGKLAVAAVLGLLPVVAAALALGPVFCSWVCPWGLLSEGVDFLKVRVFRWRHTWSEQGFSRIFPVRLVSLAFFLLWSWLLATPLVALLAPPRLLSALPQELFYLGARPLVTGSLLLAWLLAELFLPRRLVCRALCPVGGLWNFLRVPWTLSVRFRPSLCLNPKVAPCHLRCPWGIDPRAMRRYDGCTNCLRCVEGCPSAALVIGFGRSKGEQSKCSFQA
ncbi:MAG: 4Fe-4S binding protein [Thermoanaerobaculaceae bacterium]